MGGKLDEETKEGKWGSGSNDWGSTIGKGRGDEVGSSSVVDNGVGLLKVDGGKAATCLFLRIGFLFFPETFKLSVPNQ